MTSSLEGGITELRITKASVAQQAPREYILIPASDILRHKDDPTVIGFMIRCSEANQHLSHEEKQRFLRALMIAPDSFTNKVCCMLDTLEDSARIAAWLRKFTAASVELVYGLDHQMSELSYADVEELDEAYISVSKRGYLDAIGETTVTLSSFRTRSHGHHTGNGTESTTHLPDGSLASRRCIDQDSKDFWA
jgi:hypothetical protein